MPKSPLKKRSLLVAVSVVAAAVSLAASQAPGAALVTYDFENYTVSADTGAPASATAGLLTATNLAPNAGSSASGQGFLGRGSTGNAGNYFFSSGSAPIAPSNGAGRSVGTQAQYTYDTIAGAVTNGAYYSLTLTPAANGTLSFAAGDTFTFALQVRSGSTAGTVPYTVQFYVRTNLDNYAADVGSSTALTLNTANSNVSANQSISLASLGTTATAGQAITFRIYPVDNQQGTGVDDFKFDNVVLNGTYAVPEPGTYAFLGLGTLGLLMVVRRRAIC